MNDEKPLTTGQAANELGYSAVAVNRWCHAVLSGKPSPFQPGACWRAGHEFRIKPSAISRIKGEPQERDAKAAANQ